MTESEWLHCTDPSLMLQFLQDTPSDRKIRLFGCACCRRVWPLLKDDRSRWAVEIAERHADAQATKEELEAASEAACNVWETEVGDAFRHTVSSAAYNVTIPLGWLGGAPAFVAADEIIRETASGSEIEGKAQSNILRDLFGNPHRSVKLPPSTITPAVVAVAQTIYDERAFDRMPELAAALEAAGCTDTELLAHCRKQVDHVRGCWVVDLMLGKS